jgi:hypothetical protein
MTWWMRLDKVIRRLADLVALFLVLAAILFAWRAL